MKNHGLASQPKILLGKLVLHARAGACRGNQRIKVRHGSTVTQDNGPLNLKKTEVFRFGKRKNANLQITKSQFKVHIILIYSGFLLEARNDKADIERIFIGADLRNAWETFIQLQA